MTLDQAIELGMEHHRAGRLREAESIYRQVLAHDPRHAGALHLLGVIARQSENYDKALNLIQQAIAIHPHSAGFHANLCDVLCAMKRFEEAVVAGRRAIAIDPNLPAGYSNLGNAFEELGRADEAEAAYRAAVAAGATAAAHNNLGCILRRRGDVAAAITQFTAALHLDANFVDAKLNLAESHNRAGRELQDAGEYARAAEAHSHAVELRPDFAAAFNDLGNSFNSLHRTSEAEAAYRRAIALDPNIPEPYSNLGTILHNRGEHTSAIEAYENALRVNPDMAVAFTNLANAKQSLGQLDDAAAAAKRAIELSPELAPAYGNLGNALRDQGRIEEAIEAYRKGLSVRPDFAELHSNLVHAMHFRGEGNADELLAAHHEWAARHADHLTALTAPHENDRDPERRLRIGYVSPDFRIHPVAQFLPPLLESHDHENVHITCYSNVASPDAVTTQIRAMADEWRDVIKISDAHLAEMIRHDRIDILIDLALHSAGNRLLAFARKPAPLQVSYLGYPGTTGLAAMDYRLTDPYLDPPDSPSPYVERPLRLPRTYWCYSASPDSPAVAPPAFESSNHITFGCLNSFAKVSEKALQAWAEILRQVEGSRMIIYAGEGSHRVGVRAALDNRVEFVARQSPTEYFRTYNLIDIALDPFPYAGGTTTCDALWMGVPVVTLAGKIAVHRSGVSLLSNAGLPELIGWTTDEYVRIATELATDRSRLREIRATLRPRMMQSPLMDAKAFAADFEAALRGIWREWCFSSR